MFYLFFCVTSFYTFFWSWRHFESAAVLTTICFVFSDTYFIWLALQAKPVGYWQAIAASWYVFPMSMIMQAIKSCCVF